MGKLLCKLGFHKWYWDIWRKPSGVYGHTCMRCGIDRALKP